MVSEGDPTDAIYIILEGRVRIFVANENGKEVTLNRQGPGEYFGELSLDGGSQLGLGDHARSQPLHAHSP